MNIFFAPFEELLSLCAIYETTKIEVVVMKIGVVGSIVQYFKKAYTTYHIHLW